MFSVGGALRELQNVAGLSGHTVDFGTRVGHVDPRTYWTPERLRVTAERNAKMPTTRYERRPVGGPGLAPAWAGGGTKVAAGYDELPGAHGERPRPMRSATAALTRVAARGRAGFGRKGYGDR